MKGKTMSETPRTDGLLIYLSTGVDPKLIPHSWVEPLVTHSRTLERDLAAAQARVEQLTKRTRNQRTELRRLNKYLGPYWAGFRKGIDMEAACKLRGIMNKAFGHKNVRAAEQAALAEGDRHE